MKEKHERQFKGVWIAAEIWENRELTWLEKCLLAEIDCLDHPQNGCTASNQYLAEMFGSSAASIANMLSKLRRLGYIENATFDGRRRSIRVNAALTHGLRQAKPSDECRLNPSVKSEGGDNIIENKVESIDEKLVASAPLKQRIEPVGPKPSGRAKVSEADKQAHKQFIDLWMLEFLNVFQVAYRFDGGKDAKAVKTLLTTTKKTPDELIKIAVACWKRRGEYPFGSAVTIAGFNSQFNVVQVRLLGGASVKGRRVEEREAETTIEVQTL